MPILPFGDKSPKIDPQAFVSPQATIVGNVEIGSRTSIWPGAVIRGDHASVRIGGSTCVQDSAVIHAHSEENPAIIGNNIIIKKRSDSGFLTLSFCCPNIKSPNDRIIKTKIKVEGAREELAHHSSPNFKNEKVS